MRKLIAIAGLIFGFWLFMPLPASAEVIGSARLSLIEGDVAIQTRDTGSEWGAASINTPITPGTRVWVPENGKAEIQFLGGSYLRAAENTEADITNLNMDNKGNITQVGVPQGRTYIYYAGFPVENSVFQVDTPVASARAYGASRFKVDVYEDGYTEVSVMSGDVYAEGQNGNTKVDPGSMLSIGTDQNAELSPKRQADGWDRWNQSKDSMLAQTGPSRKYVPSTLGVYSNDLDTNGRWVSTPDYGNVWTPTGVAADWSPYRIGRWCWIGGDYVWVSYEPWGWVPYHYGRWAFVGSIGWCWVPPPITAYYWSPGFVAWISTPTCVSWVPLAPGEIYYGRGYYGPHSVNITNINIKRINITNVYVNAKVVNAVTVVNRQTFLTGRAERVVNAPRNPFTAGVKPSIGRPDIKPERATAVPNPGKVFSQKELPSREIVTRGAKIEKRPVAAHKDVSVFKPGERVTSMRVNRSEHPRPNTEVQKPESRQPSLRRGETSKPPEHGREAGPPPAQKGEKGGPPVQREFGVAPPHKGEPGPPAQMNKPISPTQRKEFGPSKQINKPVPPGQRKEVGPPPAQKGQTGGPSTQREFGIAPPRKGESAIPPPPVRKEQMNKPSTPNKVTPQTQAPKSVTPKREQMSTPPVQRRELVPPPAQRGQPGGPSTQREFGIAPLHRGESGAPPAQMMRPMPPVHRGAAGPSVQMNQSVPPAHKREVNPPAR
jgi:hypothetical protein